MYIKYPTCVNINSFDVIKSLAFRYNETKSFFFSVFIVYLSTINWIEDNEFLKFQMISAKHLIVKSQQFATHTAYFTVRFKKKLYSKNINISSVLKQYFSVFICIFERNVFNFERNVFNFGRPLMYVLIDNDFIVFIY